MKTKTTPKDFFLHAGAAIALYVSATALMNLFFSIVDKLNPDALSDFWSVNSVVLPISILIVLVPALYVVEWFIFRDIFKIPEKKELWVRKWRIYTTLFLTALTMAGDIIVLLNVYLNGEITERFMWKIMAVFIVSALIFAYYILSRIGAVAGPCKTWRIALAWTGGVLAFAAVIGGFVIVGSPAKQRALNFDEQRVQDLATLQNDISSYVYGSNALPASLSVLASLSASGIGLTDPQTGAPYEYQKLPADGPLTYELCATFDLSSAADPSSDYGNGPENIYQNVWTHAAGDVCFTENAANSLGPQ